MGFPLDTNVLTADLKGDRRVFPKWIQYGGRLYVSTISLAELAVVPHLRQPGAWADPTAIDAMLTTVRLLDVDEPVARLYGKVAAGLFNAGAPLPTADLLIAATALHHGLTMVTANRRHFDPVPELIVQDWIAA